MKRESLRVRLSATLPLRDAGVTSRAGLCERSRHMVRSTVAALAILVAATVPTRYYRCERKLCDLGHSPRPI